MERPADFSLMDADGGRRAVLSGDWTATAAGDAVQRLRHAIQEGGLTSLDLTTIKLKSAGRSMGARHGLGSERFR